MIGQTVHSRRPISPGLLVLIGLGVGSLVLGIALDSVHPAIFAVAPLTVALLGWLNRPRDVVLVVEDNALVPLDGQPRIEYASIRSVTIGGGRPDSNEPSVAEGPIRVVHELGVLEIPSALSVPTPELYAHLIRSMPQRSDRPVHQLLAEAYGQQVERFGEEQVVVVHQRALSDDVLRGKWRAVVGPAMFWTGALWFAIMFFDLENDALLAWGGVGMLLMAVGGLVWLIQSSRRRGQRRALRRHGPACLVMGPAGLALAQHDLCGQLRWEEVTRLKYGAASNFGSSRKGALHIHVAGGRVILLDIYEQPLSEIAQHIAQNTQKPLPQ